MKNSDFFNGKNILVLGLAKSGFAASRLLVRLGANVIVNDAKPYEDNEEAKLLRNEGIEVICGAHPLSLLDEPIDFVVKNPGIPYSNVIVKKALQKNIPVITEVEIASIISEAEMIAITGSNGKTTTTTLIGEMLQNSSKNPIVAGNIGTVVCEVAEKATKEDVLVTEVSSFQLQGTIDFHPKVAVLLNIIDAHLDYHGTKENYIEAKSKIYDNLTEEDFLVYNADDPIVVKMVKQNKRSQKVPFSLNKKIEEGSYLHDGTIYFQNEAIIKVEDIVLPGKHNLENILAAVSAAKLMGTFNEQIVKVLTSFSGVRHRLQFVETINGRKFYNDSKATNIFATETAINAFSDPLILLAGGLDRGNHFDSLIPALEKIKGIVVFGQTKEKLMEVAKLANVEQIVEAENVVDAVPKAFELSNEGDIILLSPACASWDQFKTFEERGDKYIEAIYQLKESII